MQPGPLTARLYLRALALVSLIAWLSIGSQLLLLIGEGGLLPVAPLLDEARRLAVPRLELPTLFWFSAADPALVAAVALGAAASLFGLLRPGRAWLLLSLPLYLSVSVAAQDFCGFQWDVLLIEVSFVSLWMDWRRPTRVALWLPQLVLIKLYVESAIAKLLSPVGDWLSGTAMAAYFETAPLPTPLAPSFHALPLSVLHALSWITLLVELIVPWLAFGPRRARRIAFVALTSFQLVNLLTANYGFFVPLTFVLHLLLLDDETLVKLRLGRAIEAEPSRPRARIVSTAVLGVWLALSLLSARDHLGGEPPAGSLSARILGATEPLRRRYEPLRIIGTYHLFATVTTERIEPIFEVRTGAEPAYTELALRYKPGPVDRALPFVAPHQPRVDFQLWFHGLRPSGHLPGYVVRLMHLLCEAPERVAPLFVEPPPHGARAVRLRYARYHFAPRGEAVVWKREPVLNRPELVCGEAAEEQARLEP